MTTIAEYLDAVDNTKKESFIKLLEVVRNNIPVGFNEELSYKMIGFIVPKTTYSDGYHCDTKLPLPFVNLAAKKNFIAIYHMGIYAKPDLLDWFVAEFPKHSKLKLDMGKSCIRFKKTADIPFELIGQLMQKMTVQDWITCYESNFKKK